MFINDIWLRISIQHMSVFMFHHCINLIVFFIILKVLLNLNYKLPFLINSSTYTSKDSVIIHATSDRSDSLTSEHCLQAYSFNKIK